MTRRRLLVSTLLLICALPTLAAVPTPSEFLKFQVGADRQLADYRQISAYFKALAAASPRIQIETLGKTTLGEDMFMAVISSEENLKNKDKYREIARKLADPRGLSQQQIDELVGQAKLIVMVTCNIHSTEIGASQMAMEWAHALVTANDPETQRRLDNIILLLVPSLNPDGQIMVTEWYRKNVGTKYEGGPMPWLYHHYTGHDNNRDWFMLTQKETQNVTRVAYREWFPQVWLDEHQMGSTGPRIFVPPYTEPAASSIHPLMWRGVNIIGTQMAWRLEEAKKSGVIYGYAYDAYWPGSTDGTAWWKNVFGLLTETASARVASPIDVPPSELRGGTKGLMDYRVQANYPNPWPGGRWGLREIMDYERIASDALLETCANHREDFLRGALAMAQDAIREGKPGEYWLIGADQRDGYTAAKLAFLMREHGVEVRARTLPDDRKEYAMPTAQPYARFIAEMLSTHRYPKVRASAGGAIIPPYDVTTWSLPLMMGVEVKRTQLADAREFKPLTDADWPDGGVEGKGSAYAVLRGGNNVSLLINDVLKSKGTISVSGDWFKVGNVSYPPGTLVLQEVDAAELAKKHHVKMFALAQPPQAGLKRLHAVRVAMYKPWMASIDEGWTRFVLEQYHFNLKDIDNKIIKSGKLKDAFDVIILPDVDKNVIVEGKPKREGERARYFEDLPPDYAGGIGKEGVTALKDFVENGGTLITLASSGELVADEFNLPVRNALASVKPEEFNCPGSILRLQLDPKHPVNYGMPEETPGFVDEGIAWQTMVPGGGVDREVIAKYPADAEDVLMSGWIRGAERLENRAAAVSFTSGKGKVVMFGFRPQHRAQTDGTFKMLFNAIYWGGMEESQATATKAAGK